MNNDTNGLDHALEMCVIQGVELDVKMVRSTLEEYISLIREWNDYALLVSKGDAFSGLVEHCADSLSLAPYVKVFFAEGNGTYVDIGSGGGFPAIVLCALFPEMSTLLIERNEKKVTFLRKVVGRLGLKPVSVENSSFEGDVGIVERKLVTCRAIEHPETVLPRVLSMLNPGDLLLCQSEAVRRVDETLMSRFLLKDVEDEFSVGGVRRSKLYRIELTP